MTNHPITPPPELIQKWTSLANEEESYEVWSSIATQAAQWGADQQLEACCEVMRVNGDYVSGGVLRAIRRPTKSPSLKEQALKGLDDISTFALGQLEGTSDYEEYKKIADTVLVYRYRPGAGWRVLLPVRARPSILRLQRNKRRPAPEPVAPTDEEMMDMAEFFIEDKGLLGLHNAGDFARAVLARWGRPKPPTLKEQALKGLDDISTFALGQLEGTSDYEEYKKIADTIRKALESL